MPPRQLTLKEASGTELVLTAKQVNKGAKLKSPVSTSKKIPQSFSQQYKQHQHETCADKGWRSVALGRHRGVVQLLLFEGLCRKFEVDNFCDIFVSLIKSCKSALTGNTDNTGLHAVFCRVFPSLRHFWRLLKEVLAHRQITRTKMVNDEWDQR